MLKFLYQKLKKRRKKNILPFHNIQSGNFLASLTQGLTFSKVPLIFSFEPYHHRKIIFDSIIIKCKNSKLLGSTRNYTRPSPNLDFRNSTSSRPSASLVTSKKPAISHSNWQMKVQTPTFRNSSLLQNPQSYPQSNPSPKSVPFPEQKCSLS